MWDVAVPGAPEFYVLQPFERACEVLPLPQSDKVRFLFGCETDQDKHMTVGITPAVMDKLDFIIISTLIQRHSLPFKLFVCEFA